MAMSESAVRAGVLLSAAACLAGFGCRPADAPTAAADTAVQANLVVLSPHGPEIRDAFCDRFSSWYEQKYREVLTIRWIQKGTLECQRELYARKQDDAGADIFFGGGVAVHQDVAARGYAEPIELDGELLAGLPGELHGQPLRAADGTWFGSALSGFGILYSKTGCAARDVPPPRGWSDLAAPAYRGWVAVADPAVSGSTLQCLVLILLERGWDEGWPVVLGIMANCNGVLSSSSQLAPHIRSGLAIAGLMPDFMARMSIALDPETLAYAGPEPDRAVLTPDPIMVLKGAANRVVARRFLEFVLSAEGQRLWALPHEAGGPDGMALYRYPVRPDVYDEFADRLVVPGNPFKSSSAPILDTKAEAAWTTLLPTLLTAACGRNHLALQRAWRIAAAEGEGSGRLAALRKPPMDAAAAMAAAEQMQRDPESASRLAEEWTGHFRALYEQVAGPMPAVQNGPAADGGGRRSDDGIQETSRLISPARARSFSVRPPAEWVVSVNSTRG